MSNRNLAIAGGLVFVVGAVLSYEVSAWFVILALLGLGSLGLAGVREFWSE